MGVTATAGRNPRFEADERPPLRTSLGLGAQFSLMATATLLVTPVIVATESGQGEDYLTWMVFASLVVVGLSTLLQVKRIGPLGAGAVLPMFTAAVSIPFCITAARDGGPAALTTLVLATAIVQLFISRWLFILRRVVTPTVGGIVVLILSITLASVVFHLLDRAAQEDPVSALVPGMVTLAVVAAITLRGAPLLRLWGPVIGIVAGTATAAAMGVYDASRALDAAWVGVPASAPGLAFDFGVTFWTLLPSFLFLGVIFSIHTNGESIAMQRVAWRDDRAIDFKEVQGSLAGGAVSNLLAGLAATVPNIINSGIIAFTRTTGVASRTVGYSIGIILLAVAFTPKFSALFSTIPGPVMAGYLMFVCGTLFVDGARTVILNEANREKVVAGGICFWIGAAFQFGLITLPDVGPVVGGLFKSGITTGGFAAILMILYLELTNPRRMRFQSRLNVESLPELNEFIGKFATRRRWDAAMRDRLSAVAEETLLTLAPLDLEGGRQAEEAETDGGEDRRLVVVASSEGPSADLEFIAGPSGDLNIEDRIRQLQQHDAESFVEDETSLVLLRAYAASVRHQQFHGTDIVTVRVNQPGAR